MHLSTKQRLFLVPAVGALALGLAGWQGGGYGNLSWTAGDGEQVTDGADISVDAVGQFPSGGNQGRVVQTVALPGPGGDGVLTLKVPMDRVQGSGIRLPDSEVKVAYTEYGADGSTAFHARVVAGGYVRISGDAAYDDYLALAYDLELNDGDRWRHLRVERINIRPALRDADGDVSGDSVDASFWSGCTGWADDDEDAYAEEDSGCGGDDVSDSYGESEPETSGCAGDDVDTSSSSDSGGGADCESCDGDAVAAVNHQRPRRSPLVRRVVRWLPWLSIFMAIHLMRTPGRRRRRRWRGRGEG